MYSSYAAEKSCKVFKFVRNLFNCRDEDIKIMIITINFVKFPNSVTKYENHNLQRLNKVKFN